MVLLSLRQECSNNSPLVLHGPVTRLIKLEYLISITLSLLLTKTIPL